MKNNWKYFWALQIALFISSMGGICSKLAGRQEFLSKAFVLYYGLLLATLFIYAIIWQQVLKKISLTVAYACKGIGIFYGILWGIIVFDEEIKWNMILGAVLVLIGVYFYVIEEMRGAK